MQKHNWFSQTKSFLSKMRRGQWLILVACLFLTLSVAGVLILFSPVRRSAVNETQIVMIEPGSSALQIAKQLEEAGLIRSSTAFHILGRLTGASGRMQAGIYEMSPSESPKRLLERLRAGDTMDQTISVTIPEGYTIKQIAEVLAAKGIISAEEFIDYVKIAPLPYPVLEEAAKELEPERRLEGYLFPDTYKFLPGMPAQEIVSIMLNRFREVTESLLPASVFQGEPTQDTPVPLTLDQLIALASIVEKEAVVEKERATIAGVFYNRLRINQRLQSCATVQYLLGFPKPRLSDKDMAIDSPYNTYVVDGLPIGPIANPGAASIRAVINPASTPYYYFVAKEDGSGEHVFSKTFAEHQQATRAIRSR